MPWREDCDLSAVSEKHAKASLGEFLPADRLEEHARSLGGPPPGGTQPDVLVVDDDGELRDGILSLLDDEGLSGVGAEDGAEALERLEAGLMPRLVLVDLEMPRMNGWAFVRRLEDQPAFSALPIIVMSGIAAPGFAPPRKNDAGFLRKPFDPAELVRVTRRWLAEA